MLCKRSLLAIALISTVSYSSYSGRKNILYSHCLFQPINCKLCEWDELYFSFSAWRISSTQEVVEWRNAICFVKHIKMYYKATNRILQGNVNNAYVMAHSLRKIAKRTQTEEHETTREDMNTGGREMEDTAWVWNKTNKKPLKRQKRLQTLIRIVGSVPHTSKKGNEAGCGGSHL